MKKTLGYVLVVLGVLDLAASWALPEGSPVDPILMSIFGYETGALISQFSAWVFIVVGGVLVGNDGKTTDDKDLDED
tara:strand:+ start:47 stop:277 length:231 start_codon:yes stop_codon:yes gene_type:complete